MLLRGPLYLEPAGGAPTLELLDAGTGLNNVTALLGDRPFRGTIVLGHLHWDHVIGLPFFVAGDPEKFWKFAGLARTKLDEAMNECPIGTPGTPWGAPEKAARIGARARDVTEYVATLSLQSGKLPAPMTVAYHAACSLQHGQKVMREPVDLLRKSGFVVKEIPEGHLCCGSAGTYNILQPALANQLRARKIANIEPLKPDVIAAGNIGCITQIAAGTTTPVVHTIELLDWASGGPVPEPLVALAKAPAS